MAVTVHTGTLFGVDSMPVEVEVDLVRRLPGMVIVGLPGGAVRESTDRVRSALSQSGNEFPRKRVVVNLAPADLRKTGTGFDLPIAVGILAASGQVPSTLLPDTAFAAEVSLAGRLRRSKGALPLALMARAQGFQRLVLSQGDAAEAAVVPGIDVLGATDLASVVSWMRGEGQLRPPSPRCRSTGGSAPDLQEVRGQARARRALEVAAAGGHNLLLVGSPGCGKTMLAARMPGILPSLCFDEAVDVTRVYSAAGLLPAGNGLLCQRPFRAPHHSITAAGMVGTATLQPGEVSLAHHGVLFLDEVAEFRRSVLELLRGPLEDRSVRLVRAAGSAVLPANVSLVAAANPCPCGYAGHPTRACTCSPAQVDRYRARLSGPLMDRIDLQVWVQPVGSQVLVSGHPGEPSCSVRERVEEARDRQRSRAAVTGAASNATLRGDAIRAAARPTEGAEQALQRALDTYGLSARAWARILKVARTIADLDRTERVEVAHVLEATAYRLPEGQDGRS
ncbi:MAG: YifB family Mg chelatase-like AAA ATPase [Myxococcota bacterium]|nr:YifB family Mg chelatase-like AAA ATPase [Myxococcota bacterium]